MFANYICYNYLCHQDSHINYHDYMENNEISNLPISCREIMEFKLYHEKSSKFETCSNRHVQFFASILAFLYAWDVLSGL